MERKKYHVEVLKKFVAGLYGHHGDYEYLKDLEETAIAANNGKVGKKDWIARLWQGNPDSFIREEQAIELYSRLLNVKYYTRKEVLDMIVAYHDIVRSVDAAKLPEKSDRKWKRE